MSKLVESNLPCPSCPSSAIAREGKRRRNLRWINKHRDHARKMWREGAKRWRKTNKLSSLLISARRRAKLADILFAICAEDFGEMPKLCPVLKIPITIEDGPRRDGSPSIDRIDNSKGYIRGNVRLISYRANRLKSDMTMEDCLLLLEDFKCHQLS